MIDLDLLENIYDVVLGRSTWDQVMGRLRVGFSAEAGLLIAYGRGQGTAGVLCWSGHDEAVVRSYRRHFAAINPYAEAMRHQAFPPGAVVSGDALVPGKVFCASQFYADFFRPNGMRHTAGGHVRTREGLDVLVGMPRSPAAGPYRPEEIRRLQVYFNQIRRALELQDQLRSRVAAPDFDGIAARYRLTPAEARLLELLAEIGSLKRCAQRADRSYNTLRVQLAAVFQKTGVRSQTQLMRLIHQGVPD